MKKNSLMNSLFGILPPLFFDKPSAGGAIEARGAAANEEGAQLTGVARYLKKLEQTGVERYLAQLQAFEDANKPVIEESEPEPEEEIQVEEAVLEDVEEDVVEEIIEEIVEPEAIIEPEPSGVEKYLSQQSENPITRVAKYLLKQSILSREIPVTGVAKYVTKQEYEGHAVTGVAKYVTKQSMRESASPGVTGVAKYVLKNELQAKDTPLATGVAKYVSCLLYTSRRG